LPLTIPEMGYQKRERGNTIKQKEKEGKRRLGPKPAPGVHSWWGGRRAKYGGNEKKQ